MTDKIRVVTIVSALAIGGASGGSERFGIELATSLDRDRFIPMVCAIWRYGVPYENHFADELREAGIEVIFGSETGRGNRLLRFALALRNIARHYRSLHVDILHSHQPLAGLVACILRPAIRAGAMVRTQQSDPEWGEGRLQFVLRHVFSWWIYPLAFDAEVCVAPGTKATYDRRPGARIAGKQTRLIYNAIRTERLTGVRADPGVRRELGFAADDLVVGNVGRLSPEKGVRYLIDAARLVCEREPRARFLIVGDGPLRDELRTQVETLGLGGVVCFTGARTDVEVLYGVMDLFALPSLREGLPTVVMESMASNVAVVATNVPGTRELVRDGQTGWLARRADPADLAERILDALASPEERARRAQRARADILPLVSLSHVTGEYEKLYVEIAKRAGAQDV